MSPLLLIILSTWLAGLASFIGGVLARLEPTPDSEGKREIVHGIVAFGGGILVAAVAFALVPEGIEKLHPALLAVTFCGGGVLFCIIDIKMAQRGGTKAQFLAMLMDFVPEAMSLGAVFEADRRLGVLLAAFIAAQNLPEGFNAYKEITRVGPNSRRALITLLASSLLGPIAGCGGYLFLRDRAQLTAGIMSFAAGGILYLIFQDIAPKSTMRRHWTPPIGAVLGFAVGMIGKQLLG